MKMKCRILEIKVLGLVGWLVGCWHHWDLDLGKIMLFIFYFFLKEV